jgi:hypothetical protein
VDLVTLVHRVGFRVGDRPHVRLTDTLSHCRRWEVDARAFSMRCDRLPAVNIGARY